MKVVDTSVEEGCRANLIYVLDSKIELFFSQWDGNRISELMEKGAETCKEYFKGCQISDYLLSNFWCEGGILIDFDHRMALFFELNQLKSVALQKNFIQQLKIDQWEDWTVEWANRGVLDFAMYLDVYEDYILAEKTKPVFEKVENWEKAEIRYPELETSILVTIFDGEKAADYLIPENRFNSGNLLVEGENLIKKITENFPKANLETIDEKAISEFFLIDTEQKGIFANFSTNKDDRYLDEIEAMWPDWMTERITDGMDFILEYTGRKISENIDAN